MNLNLIPTNHIFNISRHNSNHRLSLFDFINMTKLINKEKLTQEELGISLTLHAVYLEQTKLDTQIKH
jgi:hypothetical protein